MLFCREDTRKKANDQIFHTLFHFLSQFLTPFGSQQHNILIYSVLTETKQKIEDVPPASNPKYIPA